MYQGDTAVQLQVQWPMQQQAPPPPSNMSTLASSLMAALPGMQHPAVRKLLGWKQGDEEEKWAEKAVDRSLPTHSRPLVIPQRCIRVQSGEEAEEAERRTGRLGARAGQSWRAITMRHH